MLVMRSHCGPHCLSVTHSTKTKDTKKKMKRTPQINRISYILFRNIYVLRSAIKNQNKDFIKAVQGGGLRFMKLFHSIQLFLGKASLIRLSHRKLEVDGIGWDGMVSGRVEI